jgi:hypothetical protein
MRVDESCNTRSCLTANSHRLSCPIIDFELVQMLMRVDDRFGYSRAVISTQLLSTLMQFLFLFDRGTRVEKTLMQILASQLSYTSWSLLTGAWELRKLSSKLSLHYSHVTLGLTWPGYESWENSHANSHLSTPILVWPKLKIWRIMKDYKCLFSECLVWI